MAESPLSRCWASPRSIEEEECNRRTYEVSRDHLSTLPGVDGCAVQKLYHYNGWFAPKPLLVSAIVAQQLFQPKPSDILVATVPKSGTTWLKSLLFATVNRNSSHYDTRNCLATLSPHVCVPFLEFQVYTNDQVPDLDLLPSPRLFATHIPFHDLPALVIPSRCKIVYLCRDPKDTFVSLLHFVNVCRSRMGADNLELEIGFDGFCNGISLFGPFWDHVLGYWNASLERPEQVMFMKYEVLMKDPIAEVRRLAEFVGCPFAPEENKERVVERIVSLCGFESLSSLEVNRTGNLGTGWLENRFFFRQGGIGDWVNHLTPEMACRMDKITEDKFRGSGLTL